MSTSPLTEHYLAEAILGEYDGCQTAKAFGEMETEYKAVRKSIAISDNCHYGKFRVSGSDALDLMNRVVIADIARLAIGRATWTFMLHEDGRTLCDVYVVCAGDEYLVFSEGVQPSEVLAVLNAEAGSFSAEVADISADVALIGLDGPYAWELLKELVGVRMLGLRYLEFLEKQPLGSGNAHVIRAGKTGEFGYQVMVPASEAADVWKQLMEGGKTFDIQPVGYDTMSLCRLENRFINMHREGAETKNPLELNCRVMIDREKDEYIGSASIEEAIEGELENRIIGLCIDGDAGATPELGAEVSADGETVGRIVNSGYSPSLGKPIALALLSAKVAYVGLDFDVNLADSTGNAKTVSAPFIFNESLTVRPQEDSYHNR